MVLEYERAFSSDSEGVFISVMSGVQACFPSCWSSQLSVTIRQD